MATDVPPPPDALPLPDLILPSNVVTVAGRDGVPVDVQLIPQAPDRVARLSWPKRFGLVLIPVTLVGLVWGGPSGFFAEIKRGLAPEVAAVSHRPANGAALFAANCANCHGRLGEGNGPVSLTTKARYFGAEPYKFTDTAGTRVPTDARLVETLKRGIPGSSMPSFAGLRDDELKALVGHVRTLARRGKFAALMDKARADFDNGGDEPDPAALAKRADAECAVGTPLPVPAAFPAASAASIVAGQKVFAQSCASCHGPEGLGNGPQVAQLKNDNGTPAVPRNLAAGVFKGGHERPHLYARVRVGIPGTPMPAGTAYTDAEIGDLLNYVLSLSGAAGGREGETALK